MKEEIEKLKDALVGNYPDYYDIFCSKCWGTDHYTFHGNRNDKKHMKAAKSFHDRGWTVTDGSVLCPNCKKT